MNTSPPLNVLLVEDNRADAHLWSEFIGQYGGSQLHWVTDGREALDYIAKRGIFEHVARPDAILLDLGLPRVSGYQALKQIKQHPDYKSIPVVVLTTSCNPFDQRQCMELGADAFFSKPRNLQGYESLAKQLIEIELPKLVANDNLVD